MAAGWGEGRVRGNLAKSLWDGVFFSLMVGLGETYLPAFALALGHGEVLAGLVATVPMLVIFLGTLGGFISAGFLGLFIGPVVLSVGYKLFEAWLQVDERSAPTGETPAPLE